MIRFMALWRVRPWLTAAFLLSCAMTLFFAVRFTAYTIYWATHRDMPVEAWMAVGHVARSWGLDPVELDALAGLPEPEVKGCPHPLSEIARDQGVPVTEVIKEV